MSLNPIFRHLCPNCGKEITSDRLEKGLPCKVCLETELEDNDPILIGEMLKKSGKLYGYSWLYYLENSFREFKEYFEKTTGYILSSAQKSWARRLLYPESFSIVAPTGVGKSTLLMVYTAFRAINGSDKKIMYLTPTENLVAQTYERLKAFLNDGIAFYYSSMPKKLKEEMTTKINNGEFKILIITPGYLMKNFNKLKEYSPFGLIVVDDVDSLLRNSKNIDRVLVLLGYSQESVEIAYELVNKKMNYGIALSNKKEDKIKQLEQEISDLQMKLLLSNNEEMKGQLIIASATGRPKGIKHLIFRELLGFEIGGGTDYLRNVIDTYKISNSVFKDTVELVKKLGNGGIIFISQSYGKNAVKPLLEMLKENGINAIQAISNSRRAIEKLQRNEVSVIVGLASRYGTIVRGIDLPEIIRYAIFIGTPARKLELKTALISPQRLLRIVMFLEEKDQSFSSLRKSLESFLSKYGEQSPLVAAVLRGELEAKGILKTMKEVINNSIPKVYNAILNYVPNDGNIIKIGSFVIRNEKNALYLYSSDGPTYLQASGRTSRLYYGHMTKGLSIIIDEMPELVESMSEKLRWISQANFVKFEDINLDEVIKELEESRKINGGKKVNIVSELIIVESPTKAKTISSFWGKPARRREGNLNIYETTTVDPLTNTVYLLTITASKGHVYELIVDDNTDSCYGIKINDSVISPLYTSIKRCLKCGYQFTQETNECPRCGSSIVVTSESILQSIKRLATEVDQILIMTDPDREGEKIAWDLYLALRPYNKNIYRSAFHEVTLNAVLEALRNPGKLNKGLVNAQISRRIDDRWVGFSTSKYLQNKYSKLWLGAGRVQTPVLGWIIDRYNEYKKELGYKIKVKLPSGNYIYYYTKDKEQAENAVKNSKIKLKTLRIYNEEMNPLPPYTTDALIYDASQKYGFTAQITMKLAQDLFYSGLITYHRTDSIRISQLGIQVAKEYLQKNNLLQYFKPRTWSEEGAHEAIRTTRPLNAQELERGILERTIKVPIELTQYHYKLYQMIFERFLASQMTSSIIEKAVVRISLGELTIEKDFNVSIIKDGFTLISKPIIENWIKKEPNAEYEINVDNVIYYKGSLIEPYKNGDLVMLMKKKNIGRPSTYAKVIESNIRHGYVIESKKQKYMIPTKNGIEIYQDLMGSIFKELLTEESSRVLEEQLDMIENQKISPIDFINSVYNEIFVKRLNNYCR
ncbi:reverse gyrase [Caldisphaera lagunensis DSM 15908]|uniref:Reverse gyrase n=1 Tax=Caldisphaera lagunensis (strain DSM 15908 / JCM 11604 / ANMR 0165 / IC-154) TaxID=1056495 RepID=L0ABQ9_CALLD|nr:reverse gyrase [Caldisphaera lagunensis]AFZ70567.1 reverse gyrase [Caldisphaera lagunensis DSM 15908]